MIETITDKYSDQNAVERASQTLMRETVVIPTWYGRTRVDKEELIRQIYKPINDYISNIKFGA